MVEWDNQYLMGVLSYDHVNILFCSGEVEGHAKSNWPPLESTRKRGNLRASQPDSVNYTSDRIFNNTSRRRNVEDNAKISVQEIGKLSPNREPRSAAVHTLQIIAVCTTDNITKGQAGSASHLAASAVGFTTTADLLILNWHLRLWKLPLSGGFAHLRSIS